MDISESKEVLKQTKEFFLEKFNFKDKDSYILSIDIGTDCIKFLVIKQKPSGLEILKSHFLPLDKTNSFPFKEITHIIKSLKKNYKSCTRNVYVNVSGKGTYVGRLTLPYMKEKELMNAIRWKVRNAVSFPSEGAILRYRFLDTTTGDKNRLLVVGISKGLSERILSIANRTNIYIKVLYPTSVSLENLIREDVSFKKDYVSVLDIGGKSTEISIFIRGELKFRRKISVSSYSITRAMTGKFVVEDKKTELTFEKAERIKKSIGFPKDKKGKIEGLPYKKIRAMMRPQLERLITEIRQSFELFENELGKSNPTILLLSGGGGRLKNLEEVLEQNLSCEVKKFPLPPTVTVNLKNKDKTNYYLQLLHSLGASLRINNLNLLPKKLWVRGLKRILFAIFKIAIISGLVFVLLSFLYLNVKESYYSERLKNFGLNQKNINKVESKYQYIQKVNSITDRITKEDHSLYLILKALSDIIPEPIYIQDLEFNRSNKVVLIKGQISLQEGNAETELIDFKSRMEKVSFFKRIDFEKIRKLRGKKNRINFKIITKLR